MMKITYLFLHLCLLAVLIHDASASCNLYPKCDCQTITKIKQLWKTAGTPENALGLLKDGYTVVYSNDSSIAKSSKKITFISDCSASTITITLVPSNCGCGETTTITYSVTESNGVITDNYGNEWYIVYAANNVIVLYVCNPSGGEVGHPVTDILIVNWSWWDQCTQNTLTIIRVIASYLGFSYPYQYGVDCFY